LVSSRVAQTEWKRP